MNVLYKVYEATRLTGTMPNGDAFSVRFEAGEVIASTPEEQFVARALVRSGHAERIGFVFDEPQPPASDTSADDAPSPTSDEDTPALALLSVSEPEVISKPKPRPVPPVTPSEEK